MKLRIGALAGMVAAVAMAAGCGSSSATGNNAGAGGSANTVVQSAHSSQLGANVLVNGRGMTLYTLSAEQRGRFVCTSSEMIPGGGSCISVWIPLTVAKGVTPTGAANLGTITRPDTGVSQVTWQGRPLYTFANDKAPGDASGNGFKDVGVWKAATIGASSSSTSGGGGGYGY